MLRPTASRIPRKEIVDTLNSQPQRVFRRSDLEKILKDNRKLWRLSGDTTAHSFIRYLLKNSQLRETKFKFPSRTEIRYAWGEVSSLEVIQTLRPNSYFTHYTALYLHNLTEQIPKTVFLNTEQPAKKTTTTNLEQATIDRAFGNAVRQSRMCADLSDQRVCLLNGKFTDQLGVIDFAGPEGEKIRVTNVERSLIDIVVRPVYSGGVFQALNAYRAAAKVVSVNKLAAYLQKLQYVYPYHQAIGFYLERAGNYSQTAIDLMKKFEIKYDFYLAYQIQDKGYSPTWRLFFPKGL